MRYSIQQVDATTWELRLADGTVLERFHDEGGRTGYDRALARLGALITERLATDDGTEGVDGLLAEGWRSENGIVYKRELAGGRDFSDCEFVWRDPASTLVPIMFQTSNDWGHMGAELAGFFTEISLAGDAVAAAGRFYDSDVGQAARDVLLGGRRFGVSVDPGEDVEATYEEECISTDEDGFCVEADFRVAFTRYEIAGCTMTPFPAFEEATIVLDAQPAEQKTAPVRAALTIPTRPPRDWFELDEPQPGGPFLDGTGDDVLVEQVDGRGNVVALACPLTIRDDGLLYGHLTFWGQCHVGNPWGPGLCASAEPSRNGYADFHCGQVICEDGTGLATGRLTVGCEHSEAFDVRGVRDHMAHAGMGWASVRVRDGEFGPWISGALEPGVTEDQVRVLRSLALSGEWVGELAAVLSVNASGLPVQRGLAASAFGQGRTVPTAKLAASISGGRTRKLTTGNLVRSCPECAKRAAARRDGPDVVRLPAADFRRLMSTVEQLDLRTRHLRGDAAQAVRARALGAVN